MQRKLSAILAADVVGYSALMNKDEAGTFDRLRTAREQLFEPQIEKHRGRVFKLMGDGLLAEFSSVVDAVECAVSLQRGLAERSAAVAEDQRIQVRIGINLGEVIVEGNDLYGEGVNVAARLEQLAEPGGICVSGKVAKEVEKKLAFGLEPMGEHRVKNIAEPITVYRVKLDNAGPPKRKAARSPVQPQYLALAAALVLVVAGVAGWFAFMRELPQPPASTDDTRRIPTLAVLPFVNMSGDPEQDYFGQGLAEDIITALSNFPNLRVMSRTSSFVYDKPVRVQQIGEELGADYVLEGSVKKADDTVRVTAQLIDAETGEHVWASRFDEEGSNPVVLQAEIADKIYTSIGGFGGEIARSEYAAAAASSDTNLEEYDYYLRGHALWYRGEPGDNAKARAIWQEGLAKFPNSTLLRLKVALTYFRDLVDGQSDDPPRDVDLGWKLLKEAEADDTRTPIEELIFHWMMAWFYQFHEGDFGRSAAEAETTVNLASYDAQAYADLAAAMYNAGHVERAVEWAEEAARRAPDGPDWYRTYLATAYYHAGRYDEALTVIEKMDEPWSYLQAVIFVRLGKLDDARIALAGTIAECPDCTIKAEATWPGGKQPQMVERLLAPYLDDLRKAGLPEG
jgi:TolB-like protein/class 3 adenylate cyclase